MKKFYHLLALGLALTLLAGCGNATKAEDSENGITQEQETGTETEQIAVTTAVSWDENATKIELSDDEILVDGEAISQKEGEAVYAANDIIFYLEGQGITYGEGEEWEEHSQEEADTHTVVHITKPGTYELSGKLSQGQIFVDLGEDTKNDPEEVVTVVLNGVDVTCEVAPAMLFYRVYECGNDDAEEATKDVDTSAAGANVIIADGTENTFTGSHVAKIFEFCELSEDGTEVIDSKKLHKYDGAFYSRRSMNVYGGTGVLNIVADNEGLDAEMHMTIHGGNINIYSGNDGINTNEDEVSVFTMNGGNLNIAVAGTTGEGDGIDSNGWLVVNGGTITASACGTSQDSGIDADMGIHLNGGTVVAAGNMMDRIDAEGQTYISLMSREKLTGGKTYTIKDADGNTYMEVTPANDFQMLVLSAEDLAANAVYTLWDGETLAAESGAGMMGPGGRGGKGSFGGMQPGGQGGEIPEGMEPKEMPESMELPEGMEPGERPHGMMPKENMPSQK